MDVKKHLKKIILNFFVEKKILLESEPIIFKTKDVKYGDYSTNIFIREKKLSNKNFLEMKKYTYHKHGEEIERIILLENNFLNIFLTNSFLLKTIEGYKSDKAFHISEEKIDYEFVSANPTGFLHIGHCRNAIIGDVMSNIFKFIGNDISRTYYINDDGEQIKNLVNTVIEFYSYFKFGRKLIQEKIFYKNKEVEEFAKNNLILENINTYDELIKEYSIIEKKVISYFLSKNEVTLFKIGVKKFDNYVSEKKILEEDFDNFYKTLREKNFLYDEDSAVWIRTQEYGDEKDRVFIKTGNLKTYLAGDLINQVQKIRKGNNKIINLWGKDHYGYEKRLSVAINLMGYKEDYFIVDYINMVKILDNNEEKNISKREGTSVTINDSFENLKNNLKRNRLFLRLLVINIEELELFSSQIDFILPGDFQNLKQEMECKFEEKIKTEVDKNNDDKNLRDSNFYEESFNNLVDKIYPILKIKKQKKKLETFLIKQNSKFFDLLRFFLISKSKDKPLKIDLGQLSKLDDKNEYFHCMYSYSRMIQIIKRHKTLFPKDKIVINNSSNSWNNLRERDLLLKIIELRDKLTQCKRERDPSVLVNYLKDLSISFRIFYNSIVVLTDDEKLRVERIFLVQSLILHYKKVFDLLGLTPINRM